jgi:site-specific DNA-cytosine methylase
MMFYNEIDPFAAAWMRELMKAGAIPEGEVDERSVLDIRPVELSGFTQCHFFAGIGVWPYALRQAGWPTDRVTWTASLPCQPFSLAGKRKGVEDERHLWPVFFELVRECKPNIIFGEQVASATGSEGTAEVQRMWERYAHLQLLQNRVERNISNCMQKMQEQYGTRMERIAKGFDSLEGEQACAGRKITSIKEERAIQPDGQLGAGEDRYRSLRSNGHSVLSCDKQGMEHAVPGQGDTGVWVHDAQHKSSNICAECRLWGLGRKQNAGGGECGLTQAQGEIGRAIENTVRAIKEKNGYSWFAALQADLAGEGYTVWVTDTCAAGVGAPHIRQRLYWFAARLGNADSTERETRNTKPSRGRSRRTTQPSLLMPLVDPVIPRLERQSRNGDNGNEPGRDGAETARPIAETGGAGYVADTIGGQEYQEQQRPAADEGERGADSTCGRGVVNGFWRNAVWLPCRDNKYRCAEIIPESVIESLPDGVAADLGFVCDEGVYYIHPLAEETPNRVRRLRGYGNAIVAPQAIEFVRAVMEELEI